MKVIRYPQQKDWNNLVQRPHLDVTKLNDTVKSILDVIKVNGDKAVYQYEKKFDGVELDSLIVSDEEIKEAEALVSSELKDSLVIAHENILKFHQSQLFTGEKIVTSKGVSCWQKSIPIQKVGLYIPGGTAPLFSTVLMLATPAKIAGCEDIVLCTPPDKSGKINPAILVAAKVAGVNKIYKAGGVQAIGAMAYGTETIPRVDKICGPGNIYVNTAKRLVYGQVDIDMFAGPSEILIIADKTANPDFVAADMLSQAEHDKMASAIVLTDSRELAEKVLELADQRSEKAERKDILAKSMEDYCAIIVCDNLDTAINFSEEIAPEHLEICVENPEVLAAKIKNCGAMFLGNYSPEPLGDYFAGPNHTLPTSGTARFFSPLNTGDFYKKMSVINYNEETLKDVYKDVAAFADSEGLGCHAAAVRARFED